jgi:hypothetical protein
MRRLATADLNSPLIDAVTGHTAAKWNSFGFAPPHRGQMCLPLSLGRKESRYSESAPEKLFHGVPEARIVQAEQEALSRIETGSSEPGGGVQGTEGATGHLRRFRHGEGRE